MIRHLLPALLAAFGAGLSAQTLLIPAAATTGDLPSSTGWPFDVTGTMRILYVYDSSHFTSAGVTGTIGITRLRLRANGIAATWAGDTIANVSVDMSTAPADYTGISATFDSNHGPDRARVYNSSLVIPAGSSTAGAAGPFHVDLVFSTPFVYDPSAGDLTIDYVSTGPTNVVNTPALDASSTAGTALARRVYTLNYTGGATGTVWSGESAHAAEFTYVTGTNFAAASPYGAGCYNRASSVYETFLNNFDLAGAPTNSLMFLPNGPSGGFTVTAGSNTFVTPTSSDLLLTDDSLSPVLTLPFTLQFGATSTNQVRVCSNGFLWLRSTETATDLSPTAEELLTLGPRIAPYWTDLNPATLVGGVRVGSIHFDVDPVTNHAVFTWLNVPEYANAGNLNTFQIDLAPTGVFELRWQGTALSATRALLTGASYGLGARNGGAVDLSAAVPFATGPDALSLRLSTSGRPILGTTIQVVTSEVVGVGLGILFAGLTQVPAPGIDLTSIGAGGCLAWVDVAASVGNLIGNLPGTTLSLPLTVPNNPALSGFQLFAQSVWLAPGANPFGILTSNGLALRVGAS